MSTIRDIASAEEAQNELRILARYLAQAADGFEMRKRLNPHHPNEHREQEQRDFDIWAYSQLTAMKELYLQWRDELKTQANNNDKKIYQSLENCLQGDLERQLCLVES